MNQCPVCGRKVEGPACVTCGYGFRTGLNRQRATHLFEADRGLLNTLVSLRDPRINQSEQIANDLEDFKQEINEHRDNYEVVFSHVKRLRKNNILRRECTYALQEKVQKGLVDDHFNIIG